MPRTSGQYDKPAEVFTGDIFLSANDPAEIMQNIYDILVRIINKIPVESKGRFKLWITEWMLNDEGKVIYDTSKVKRGFMGTGRGMYRIGISKDGYHGESTLIIVLNEAVSGGKSLGYEVDVRSHLTEEPFYPLIEGEYEELKQTIPDLEQGDRFYQR